MPRSPCRSVRLLPLGAPGQSQLPLDRQVRGLAADSSTGAWTEPVEAAGMTQSVAVPAAWILVAGEAAGMTQSVAVPAAAWILVAEEAAGMTQSVAVPAEDGPI